MWIHPNIFDLAWHCTRIMCKYFWFGMILHGNFNHIILIWHDIACGFHPNIFDLAWHCTGILCKYFWFGMTLQMKFIQVLWCMILHVNFIQVLWLKALHVKYHPHILTPMNCMCFSNGHCELRCHLQNLQMYIYFLSLFGGFKKENLQQEILAYGILTPKTSSKWSTWILFIGIDHNCMILHRFYFYFYFYFLGWVCFSLDMKK